MSKKKKCMGVRDVATAATAADTASYVLSLPKDYDFTKLPELRIPSRIDGHSVLTIAESAFSCFYRLKKVVVASGVKEIGQEAFSVCHSLTSVILPDSIKAIQPQAFYGCALRSIAIP